MSFRIGSEARSLGGVLHPKGQALPLLLPVLLPSAQPSGGVSSPLISPDVPFSYFFLISRGIGLSFIFQLSSFSADALWQRITRQSFSSVAFYSTVSYRTLRLFIHTTTSNMNRKFDRFKQWAGERMGNEVRTNLSDDFKAMETEMNVRHEGKQSCQFQSCIIALTVPRSRSHSQGLGFLPQIHLQAQ